MKKVSFSLFVMMVLLAAAPLAYSDPISDDCVWGVIAGNFLPGHAGCQTCSSDAYQPAHCLGHTTSGRYCASQPYNTTVTIRTPIPGGGTCVTCNEQVTHPTGAEAKDGGACL
ncbi:hypothetical protein BH11ARM2_BH11ARM2_03360 [soil metagenome]